MACCFGCSQYSSTWASTSSRRWPRGACAALEAEGWGRHRDDIESGQVLFRFQMLDGLCPPSFLWPSGVSLATFLWSNEEAEERPGIPGPESLSKADREKLLEPEAQVPGRQAVARLEGPVCQEECHLGPKGLCLSTPCRVTYQAAGVCTCMCMLQRRRDWVFVNC